MPFNYYQPYLNVLAPPCTVQVQSFLPTLPRLHINSSRELCKAHSWNLVFHILSQLHYISTFAFPEELTCKHMLTKSFSHLFFFIYLFVAFRLHNSNSKIPYAQVHLLFTKCSITFSSRRTSNSRCMHMNPVILCDKTGFLVDWLPKFVHQNILRCPYNWFSCLRQVVDYVPNNFQFGLYAVIDPLLTSWKEENRSSKMECPIDVSM